LPGELEGVGGSTHQALLPVDFFYQSTDQGFAIEADPVLGFNPSKDLRDMEGLSGFLEYVYGNVNIRHTLFFSGRTFSGPGVAQLPNHPQLRCQQRLIK
jgi:hypothetical protein